MGLTCSGKESSNAVLMCVFHLEPGKDSRREGNGAGFLSRWKNV